MASLWRGFKRYVIYRILHADDTPHEIAKGAAIGLFIAMTPTIGFQMVLALLCTAVLRANKAIAVALVWVSNPVTMLPIYYQNWAIGRHIIQTTTVENDTAVKARIEEISASIGGITNLAAHAFDGDFWSKVLGLVWSLGVELWIGSFLVGAACALPGYLITLWAIRFYRQRIPRPRFFRRKPRNSEEQSKLRSSRPRLRQDSA